MFIVNGVSGASLHCINLGVATDPDNEFRHSIGIGDLYSDDLIELKFSSIMNNQWETQTAQPIDYALMLKAYKTQKWQSYGENKYLLDEFGIVYE